MERIKKEKGIALVALIAIVIIVIVVVVLITLIFKSGKETMDENIEQTIDSQVISDEQIAAPEELMEAELNNSDGVMGVQIQASEDMMSARSHRIYDSEVEPVPVQD